ncbi:hypothetical protein D915_010205 [Fasciola hepatica]|uniref:Leucine Rich repeat-containing domain protein n=1 Tax=Fasciola hepatica TaxID=6192 RepID=A0A4E0R0L0_FASHE|nr:hypothetical protein D915_010205 [Fasciola hepatica]
MEESQCESEQEPSIDLESPKYSEANERIKKAESEKLEKLNLSELKLIEVPQELLDLTHLKRLHLCRNRLLEIPEELCLRLCHLRWLDLRSNLITRLPATVKHMRDLRILLLDDNSIRILPFELGLLRKLKGIYVRNNPLEFPKKQVMEKGVHGILKYLFQCYLSREECASPRGSRLYQKIMEDDKATPLEGNNSAEVVASNYPTTKDSRRNGSEVAEDSVKSLCENFEEKLSIPGTDKGIGSEEESKSPEDMNENCENPSNPLLLEEPEKIMKDQQTQSTTSWDSNYDSYDPELEEILHYSKLADAMNEANADEESNSTNSAPLQIARSGTLPWASSSTRLYKKIKKQYLFGRRNPKKLTRYF